MEKELSLQVLMYLIRPFGVCSSPSGAMTCYPAPQTDLNSQQFRRFSHSLLAMGDHLLFYPS